MSDRERIRLALQYLWDGIVEDYQSEQDHWDDDEHPEDAEEAQADLIIGAEMRSVTITAKEIEDLLERLEDGRLVLTSPQTPPPSKDA